MRSPLCRTRLCCPFFADSWLSENRLFLRLFPISQLIFFFTLDSWTFLCVALLCLHDFDMSPCSPEAEISPIFFAGNPSLFGAVLRSCIFFLSYLRIGRFFFKMEGRDPFSSGFEWSPPKIEDNGLLIARTRLPEELQGGYLHLS